MSDLTAIMQRLVQEQLRTGIDRTIHEFANQLQALFVNDAKIPCRKDYPGSSHGAYIILSIGYSDRYPECLVQFSLPRGGKPATILLSERIYGVSDERSYKPSVSFDWDKRETDFMSALARAFLSGPYFENFRTAMTSPSVPQVA